MIDFSRGFSSGKILMLSNIVKLDTVGWQILYCSTFTKELIPKNK